MCNQVHYVFTSPISPILSGEIEVPVVTGRKTKILMTAYNTVFSGFAFLSIFLCKLVSTHTIVPSKHPGLLSVYQRHHFSRLQDICTCYFLSLNFYALFYFISFRSRGSFIDELSLFSQYRSIPLLMLQRAIPCSC